MLHMLAHILKALWRERIALFWPIWFAVTALGVSFIVWAIPRRKEVPADSSVVPSHRWSRSAVLSILLLAVFLAFYIAGCLVWENFAYADNSIFTLSSLAGHDYARPIWPAEGRFFPLSHQEFNVLAHVTHSAVGFHAFRVVQLLFVCGILLILDDQLRVPARVALILLFLITPGVLISYGGLIYPEANVMFWLVCLIWSVKRFEKTHAAIFGAATVISAQFMLYYKETAFLLIFCFSAGRLLLRCRTKDGWNFKRMRDPESRLDLCLAALVAVFLLYYLAAMFPNYSMGYAELNRLPISEILSAYLRLDLLAWVLTLVVVARMVQIFRGKLAPDPLWDGLGLAGIGYIAGYLQLRMESGYYLAPADLIAVLYLGRLAILSLPRMGFPARLVTVALISLILLQDLTLTGFRLRERKNLIHAKSEIGQLIQSRYQSDPTHPDKLFFPFSNTHRIKEFGAYLSYLGIPVEGVPSDSGTSSAIRLIVKEAEVEGPCEGPGTPVCRRGDRPDSGDLIVMLPDDFIQTADADSYEKENSTRILTYEPVPSIPGWLRPFEKYAEVISHVFPHALPDHWLSASVALRK